MKLSNHYVVFFCFTFFQSSVYAVHCAAFAVPHCIYLGPSVMHYLLLLFFFPSPHLKVDSICHATFPAIICDSLYMLCPFAAPSVPVHFC